MRRITLLPVLVLLVAALWLAACNPLTPEDVAPPTSPPQVAGAGPTATLLPADTQADTPTSPPPTDTTTPEPTATRVPTLTPPRPTPLATPSGPLLAQMDAIEAEVEVLRGLEETAPITRSLMTPQELSAYLERQFEEDYAPGEIEADVRALAAFDFVPEDFDLRGVLLDLYSSQVIGFYDDEARTLYVITDAAAGDFDLLGRLTFAHEYTHGLQDEHYGLEALVDEERWSDDEILAHTSLVEGDASLAMSQYLYAHLAEVTAEDLASLQEGGDPAGQAALDAAPAIIRETFTFPYDQGLDFVMALQQEGWDAVDAAYADPPQSSEQILHPEKYLSRDEPQVIALPPLTDTLGSGWHLAEAETLGEFQTGLYLAQRLERATADVAAAGWDGDRYAVYVDGSDEVLVFATAWDGAADRAEFVDAYGQYATAKYGRPPDRTERAASWWETADQSAVLSWNDTTALVVLGPDPATVQTVRQAMQAMLATSP
jgi:hypothetical protein